MVRASVLRCKCGSHSCSENPLGYTEVPRSVQKQHREDDLAHSLQQLLLFDKQPLSMVQPENQHGSSQGDSTTDALVNHFKSTIQEYQLRSQSINLLFLVDSVEQPPVGFTRQVGGRSPILQDHISWLAATISNLSALPLGAVRSLNLLRSMTVQVLQEKLNEIQLYDEDRYDELKLSQDYKMGQKSLSLNRHDNDCFFGHHFSSRPLLLLASLTTAALSVIDGLSDRSSNFIMQMHREILQLAIDTCNGDREFAQERTFILKFLPKDIRTIRSQLRLEPRIKVFAACPNCSALYRPKSDPNHDFPLYPLTMSYCTRKELGGPECGATLFKWRVCGKQIIRTPVRPYGYHSLHDFIGEMLSRPDVEDWLERYSPEVQPRVLTDIFDGDVIRNFRTSDGAFCFRKNGPGTDLFLAWAICVDWFNPYHNKSAGKAVSVGVISLVCLNLPLKVRNEPGNIYVAGIIPGPREPSLHQVNNFLEPVINEFLQSWNGGIQYTRSHKQPNGRKVVSILLPLVADVPASRKVSGTAGHSAICFCPLCTRKSTNINDISVPLTGRGRNEHVRLAEKWRDAQTQPERDTLVAENGIRWSVLFNLPYWEPRFIVVDPMHNLFLGLIRHHVRSVIGVKYEKSSGKKERNWDEITSKKMKKILKTLKNPEGPTASRLKRYSINDLYGFHVCQSLPLPPHNGTFRKDDLISSLLSCELVGRSHETSSPGAGNSQTAVELEDLQLFNIDAVFEQTSNAPGIDIPALADCRLNTKSSTVNYWIRSDEIEAIQGAIRMTSRPSWQQSPPKSFGTSQQGKLKADQWRALMEFDLPVALVEMWTDSGSGDVEMDQHRLTLVDLTMELAIAVLWATSRRTSVTHAAQYTLHIQRYLEGLQKLSHKLVPNHHFALHIGKQLLLYGPVDGWWTYPFERLIGTLQNAKTNSRFGEMELTMLKSHYATARLRRLLHGTECRSVPRDSISKIETHFPVHAPRSYSSYILRSNEANDNANETHVEQLDDVVYDAVCSLTKESGSKIMPNRNFMVHRYFIVDGYRYTSLEYERDSIIFYGRNSERNPGIIRKIFSMPDGKVLFAVHPYLKLNPDISDPFAQWPEFGASLWSQRVIERVQLINPKNAHLCHAARRPWKDQEIYVLRPLDRNY